MMITIYGLMITAYATGLSQNMPLCPVDQVLEEVGMRNTRLTYSQAMTSRFQGRESIKKHLDIMKRYWRPKTLTPTKRLNDLENLSVQPTEMNTRQKG